MRLGVCFVLFAFGSGNTLAEYTWEASPYNYNNSEYNYENSPYNYENSPYNYENSRIGSDRAVFDNNGRRIGYEVENSKGVVNIFDNDGRRIGYKPKR